MLEFLKEIDTQAFLYLNKLHNPFFDSVMYFISGTKSWIPLYVILLAYLVYKFRINCWIPLFSICLVIVFSDQIASGFKPIVERFRPSHEPALQGLVHIVKGYTGGKYGFASSHASNTFGLAVFTALLFRKRWYTYSILAWAAVVSYSRIYLGVHYPGDVLAGALIGMISAFFVFWLYKIILKKFSKASA